MKAIDNCQFMVAIYWGLYSDSGTAWEIGYACANHYPTIVIVPNDVLEQKHSLMVANGSTNFIALSRFLSLNGEEFGSLFQKGEKKYFLNGVVQT
jgi:nucleoside 2-deoxyribosyltransferase